MTYEAAREFIKQASRYGSVLGLTTIRELMNRLDNPQDKLKLIHVAGTNGKGSTTAFLVSILACAGYRVGRYVSPAVFSYREIIQISQAYSKDQINHNEINLISYDRKQNRTQDLNQDHYNYDHAASYYTNCITREGVSEAIGTIQPICEAMVRDGFAHPTAFEIETAMAYLYLYREQVDYAVIEVGMGGRLDATNIMRQPFLSVITDISLDHMQYLGDSLTKIATEKAGIIKEGAPVVTSNTQSEILEVLKDAAIARHTTLRLADSRKAQLLLASPEGTTFHYDGGEYKIKLLGEHQIINATLAIEASRLLEAAGCRIQEDDIKEGLLQASWTGRFEIIGRNPYFIIDGAHNEDAAIHLKNTIERYFPDKRRIMIMGVFADKDYRKVLQVTAPLADILITIESRNSRALASDALATEAKNYTDKSVIDAGTIEQAVALAYKEAKEEDVIIAFGSLSFMGELRAAIIPQLVPED